MMISKLANQLNVKSNDYEIGRLQDIRKEIKNLPRKPCSFIFLSAAIAPDADYAIHRGGRKELQFNIGIDHHRDKKVIRHGVAFSLQSSRAQFDNNIFFPKIEKFNEYVSLHLEDFPRFSMWNYQDSNGIRSENHAVGPISEDWIEQGRFIMLGRLSNPGEVDTGEILADFDRLLPLYKYVENGSSYKNNKKIPEFKPGCPKFVREFTMREFEQGTRDVSLRHAVAQKLLYELLCKEVGCENVQIERPLGSAYVDAATRCGVHECFFEVKTANTVLSCLRAAIGQLLEYAYLFSEARVLQLVVVGEARAEKIEREYLRVLRDTYRLPICYRRIDIQNENLESPI